MISKCVFTLTENLRNPSSPEYVVLGSCAVLATQTVLKHLPVVMVQSKLLTAYFLRKKSYAISCVISGSKGVCFIYSWDSFKVTLFL